MATVGSIGTGIAITPQVTSAKPRSERPPGIQDRKEGTFSFNDDETKISSGDWITYDFEIILDRDEHEQFERFDDSCEIVDKLLAEVFEIEIETIDSTDQVEPESKYWSECYEDTINGQEKVVKDWSLSTPPQRPGEYDVSFTLRVTKDAEYSFLDRGTYVSETTLIVERGR
jgi:hypothetical protein